MNEKMERIQGILILTQFHFRCVLLNSIQKCSKLKMKIAILDVNKIKCQSETQIEHEDENLRICRKL